MRIMNLIIIGALPPPRGGVSTHIERLIPYLEASGIEYVVWDYSRHYKENSRLVALRRQPLGMAISFLKLRGVKVAHCLISRVSAGWVMLAVLLRCAGIRLTLTFVRSAPATMGSALKRFYCLVLSRCARHVITANSDLRQALTGCGIPGNKISVIPAFIPVRDTCLVEKPLPQNIADFCAGHRPLILTYAYGLGFHLNEDMYGLDLAVHLLQGLRSDLPQAGCVVVIPEILNEGYYKKLRADIREKGLEPFFCFAVGNDLSFIPFLRRADIFIRATNTDGDALTLREALYYGVPSVASDVCPRPEGTRLFRNRDAVDLDRVVRDVLNGKRESLRMDTAERINNADRFIDVFRQTAGVRS
jgi:glycosyltransferase involved in cell wall biosynthesis